MTGQSAGTTLNEHKVPVYKSGVSLAFMFGLHVKKIVFGPCNDGPAGSLYICCLTTNNKNKK